MEHKVIECEGELYIEGVGVASLVNIRQALTSEACEKIRKEQAGRSVFEIKL